MTTHAATRPGLLAAAALTLLTAALGVRGEAHAAEGARVALLPFRGVPAVEVEAQIVEGIPPDFLLIPIKQVDYVVGRRKPPTTIEDYVNAAKRLKATALVEGWVANDNGWRLRLTVRRGATGVGVGTVEFKAAGRKELALNVRRRGPQWVKKLLDRTTTPAPAAVAMAPAPAGLVAARQVESQGEDAPAARGAAVAARQAEDDEQPPLRRTRRAGESEPSSEETIAAEDEGPRRRRSDASPMWEVSVGPRLMARAFIFTDNVSGLPGYNLPAAPGIFGEAEFFPAARSRSGARNFGFSGQAETSVGAKTNGREGDRSHTTKASSYRIGPRYRIPSPNFSVTLGLDYGEHSFELDIDDAVPPNVVYTLVRPSVAGRIMVASGISLGLTVAWLKVLSVGGMGDDERFPRITAAGAEVGAFVGYELNSDFELRLAGDLRHYAHNMHARPGDPLVVGGALDEHFGANVLVTYRLK
jgi:hypothetical protein